MRGRSCDSALSEIPPGTLHLVVLSTPGQTVCFCAQTAARHAPPNCKRFTEQDLSGAGCLSARATCQHNPVFASPPLAAIRIPRLPKADEQFGVRTWLSEQGPEPPAGVSKVREAFYRHRDFSFWHPKTCCIPLREHQHLPVRQKFYYSESY